MAFGSTKNRAAVVRTLTASGRRISPIVRAVTSVEGLESRQLFAGYVPLAPTPSPWMTGYFTQAGTVDFQAGASLAPDVAGGEAASLPRNVPVNANGLPLLNSRAGGEGTELFIDFARDDGYYRPFSLDGDRSNFNFAEQTAIYQCWREVVGFFSQFNVNVTTVLPPTGGNNPAFGWLYVTNEFPGGEAGIGDLNNFRPGGRDNSDGATGRVSGLIHEFGHLLNLHHQSEYDKYGNKTAEYTDGYSYRSRPIMGIDYLGTIRQMTLGRDAYGPWSVADDVAKTAAHVAWSNGQGGDGFRPDDFGNTLATAYTLGSGGQQLDAFTERYNDADVFKITPTTSGPWNLTATPLYLSQAEPKLELLDASGNVIAARDDADVRNGPTNEQWLNVDLQPGTYYVRVTSGGDYAELGYYKLGATQLPTGFVSTDVGVPAVPGSVTVSNSGVFTQSGGGGDIWNSDDQFRYTYATLTGDGSITARVDGLDNLGTYTKAGVMVRQSLAANSQHAFLGLNPSGNVDAIWRYDQGLGSANVGTASGPWVRLTRTGNTLTYAASPDGVSWTTIGSRTVLLSGPVHIGLATCAWAGSRYEAYSTFSNVSVTGSVTPAAVATNALAAPTGLVATPAAGANTSVNLAWNAVSGATGYVVESSINGTDFFTLGTTGPGTTTFTHSNPAGSQRYFYRVRAANGTSLNSAASATASTVNKPNAPGFTPGGFTPTAMSIGTNEVYLTWVDSSGESGYRIEQSTDGVNWVTRYTNGANHTVSNLNNLTPGTNYTFRITPLTSVGDGVATPLIVNTQTRMAAVTNLRFTAKSPTAMTIAWDDSPLESGYRVERSTDGTNWTFMGDTAANVTTYTSSGLTAGTEYYFRVMPWNPTYDGIMSAAVFAAAPAAALPTGWANADIGQVAGTGASVNTANGAWTLASGGSDIIGNADAFHFAYTTLSGDGSITAKIDSVEQTDNAAKAGLVVRQDLTAGSKSVAVMMNAGGGYGIDLRTRTSTDGGTGYQQLLGGVTAPYWLRLTRSGETIMASYSSDGTTWTTGATINNFAIGGTFYVGLATTSFSSTQLNTSLFSNVAITQATQAPTVASAAAANSSPVTGTTTALSVLGADNSGESALNYTWSATGPAAVSFSANGTNAAKNSTATFTAAGTYTFTATITDAGGLSTTSSVNVIVNATVTSIAMSPATASVPGGSNQQFVATAKDQFGATLATQPTFTWAMVSGGGTVNGSGLYSAPTTAGSATIGATAGGVSGTASVTITAGPIAPSNLTVSRSSRRAVLNWRDNSTNETGFRLWSSRDGVTWSLLTTRSAGLGSGLTQSYTTGNLALGLWYFRVNSYNSSGESDFSNVASVTI